MASKQRLVWIGTLYIYDPISLLIFIMCQWPGRQDYTTCLCAAVNILRYAGSGPTIPVDEVRPKTYRKYNDTVECPLSFSIKKMAITWDSRECVATQATYS
jgi:hypothetical protein